MTEATALLRLQRGNEDALAWFIDKYTAYVCTVIRYFIGASMTEADVEEVASDVFLELWKQAGSVTRATVRPWLGGVARNKARQKLRERGVALSLDEDLIAIDSADLSETLEQEELEKLVRAAVFAMEPTDREIFLRYYYHCQPIAAISGETGRRFPEGRKPARLPRQWPDAGICGL